MKFFRCHCGKLTVYSSMGAKRCAWCTDCKTTLADSPRGHRNIQPPHEMRETQVSLVTDDGAQQGTLTRCMQCFRTKADLEAAGEPMVPFVPSTAPVQSSDGESST